MLLVLLIDEEKGPNWSESFLLSVFLSWKRS